MSNGVNEVRLIGNLGNEPELKYSQGGMAVVRLSVATTSTRKNKDTGEKIEETQWHTVKAFGKLAEICGQYLHKGSKVYIAGSIRYSKAEGKDGAPDKYFTDIIADEMRMLDGKPQDGSARQAQAPATKPATSQPREQEPFQDDDIPF